MSKGSENSSSPAQPAADSRSCCCMASGLVVVISAAAVSEGRCTRRFNGATTPAQWETERWKNYGQNIKKNEGKRIGHARNGGDSFRIDIDWCGLKCKISLLQWFQIWGRPVLLALPRTRTKNQLRLWRKFNSKSCRHIYREKIGSGFPIFKNMNAEHNETNIFYFFLSKTIHKTDNYGITHDSSSTFTIFQI